MAAERYTFDTNILFYSIDSADVRKHEIARRLIGEATPERVPVLLQTLGELCNSISKKRADLAPSLRQLVRAYSAMFAVVESTLEDVTFAMEHHASNGLQFWDAVLWATAKRAGCTMLLTEDFQDGRTLDGVTFRNPFAMNGDELDALFGAS